MGGQLSLGLLASLDGGWFDARPLVVLGTYRAEEVGDALRDVLRLPFAQRVDIGRLDEAAVGRIVGDMLATPDPPPALVGALAARSSGNPLFVAESLRAAVADGLLFRERGAWRVADETSGPGLIRALVGRRLDGLSEGANRSRRPRA